MVWVENKEQEGLCWVEKKRRRVWVKKKRSELDGKKGTVRPPMCAPH